MTRVLFLCSGNTCRSPMAEGFARSIFGRGHTVSSAGVETARAAQRIRRYVRRLYARDVLRRLASASSTQSGSQLAGMFLRAAREFEKELREFVSSFVDARVGRKSTLGRLARAARKSGEVVRQDLGKLAMIGHS